jgi:hypothetical protein
VQFPIGATLVGMPIEVTGVDYDGNEARGMVADIKRDGHDATVSILDITFLTSEPTATRLLAAYKKWLGL